MSDHFSIDDWSKRQTQTLVIKEQLFSAWNIQSFQRLQNDIDNETFQQGGNVMHRKSWTEADDKSFLTF